MQNVTFACRDDCDCANISVYCNLFETAYKRRNKYSHKYNKLS